MSDNNRGPDDNKDAKDRVPIEQASSHTTVHIHAAEDEKENVRGAVLCQEKDDTGKRTLNVSESESTGVATRELEYIVLMQSQGQPPQPALLYPSPIAAPSVGFMSRMRPPMLDGPPLNYDPDYEDRNAFVRLVFSIVLIMLLATTAFLFVAIAVEPVNYFFRKVGMIVALIFMIPLLAISYAFYCSECSRSPPMNIILLVLTTICQSLVCAGITVRYSTPIILMAALVTTVIVMVCLGLACTKFDFTRLMLIVLVAGLALFVLMIVTMVAMMLLNVNLKPLMIVIMVGVTLLQCVTLIIELQMILGGKSVELTADDYALAAYMLYTSIIEIFMNLLYIIGLGDSC